MADQPGDHGAHQRWVRCPHRVQEEGADPLGPVVAHGFTEAPGYTPTLLDNQQKKLLRRASLRTRDDGGPNSVLYENLRLEQEKTAPYHWAELQAFYNVGLLQHRYTLLGHPRYCDAFRILDPSIEWCDPKEFTSYPWFSDADPDDPALAQLLRQDPYRLELTVHWRGHYDEDFANNGRTGLHFLKIGDLRDPGGGLPYGIESAGDASFYAHEYQHHIFYSIGADLGFQAPALPRESVEEGLSDAFAAVFTGHDYGPRGYSPKTDPDPCADPSAYPPNPPGHFPRHACNSVTYGFWGPGPFTDANLKNVRGTIIYGALYRFQKRIKDGGWGWLLPGLYMYEAQKILSEPDDEEQQYLDELLAILAAAPNARRFLPLAQVAFEEKGVFPLLGGPTCTASVSWARKIVAMQSLAMAGPLHVQADELPSFDVFAPRGLLYQSTVQIELSNNAAFSSSGAGNVLAVLSEDAASKPVINNSPAGFFRLDANDLSFKSAWSFVAGQVKQDRRVYYRVRQCQWGHTDCIVSALAGLGNPHDDVAPYVKVGGVAIEIKCLPAAPGASVAPFSRGGAWWLIAGLLLLLRRRRAEGRA